MKLVTYTPQVNRNTIDARVDASAAQAFANIGQAQARSLYGIAGAIQGAAENIDAVNVQAASNEYTKRLNDLLYNQDNGLMNTKMQGADGITQKFEEEERRIRQEVGSQFKFLSPKGSFTFNRMTENSAMQRHELVRRHQTQQYNAYRDVTFDNALALNVQTAADNYTMQDVVEDNIREAIATTRMRYAGQGEEVLKEQERKAISGIAQQVIGRAYANGDDDRAGAYIEKYGKYMNPTELTQYSKAVHQRVLSNITRNTADGLVAKYGNNIGALYDAIYNRGEGGSGYDGSAAVAWFKEQTKNGVNMGSNTCTISVNKALMMGGGIPGNTWAPTNWEDAKKAGMAFKDRSQLRTGDIVYWWKPGSDKDADDTSHVGLYDAETGMVYQSGTSGIKPIKLDAYSITGFARPQGQGMSLEQKDALYNSCIRQINQQKALRNAHNDEIFKSLDKQLMGMSDSGNADYSVYTSMVDQIAGNDPEMRRKGYQYAQYWWKRAANVDDEGNIINRNGTAKTGSGNKGGLAMGVEDGLKQTLMYRNIESEADWAQIVIHQNPPPSKAEYERLMQAYRNKKAGTGIYKYNWGALESQFKLDNPDMDSNMEKVAWNQAAAYAMMRIIKYREDNDREPSTADVQNYINESVSKVNYGVILSDSWLPWSKDTQVEFTKGELAAAKIDRTRKLPTGQIEVHYADRNVTEITTPEGLVLRIKPPANVQDDYR